MTLTINKAGRLVIPAQLRRKAGFQPGAPLAASYENGAVMITRDVPGPKIKNRGRRRVASPTQKNKPEIDPAAWVKEAVLKGSFRIFRYKCFIIRVRMLVDFTVPAIDIGADKLWRSHIQFRCDPGAGGAGMPLQL